MVLDSHGLLSTELFQGFQKDWPNRRFNELQQLVKVDDGYDREQTYLLQKISIDRKQMSALPIITLLAPLF